MAGFRVDSYSGDSGGTTLPETSPSNASQSGPGRVTSLPRPAFTRLPDPSRYRLVSATPWVVPGAREGAPVAAELATVVRWRSPLPEPDGEGVPLELVGVVEGVAGVAVEAALYVRARLLPQGPLVADDLHALGLRS